MDRLSDYTYDLPDELIAQEPIEPRDASRLLVLRRSSGEIEHRMFRDVPNLLEPGDLLVLNDTRVTALRLIGTRPTGGRVEALLLRNLGTGKFDALVKPARRLVTGQRITFGPVEAIVVADTPTGGRVLDFGDDPNLHDKLNQIGETPLPPYIRRKLAERERYQTTYARTPGSAAAPTAGLHFTPGLLDAIAKTGVRIATITLDVGIDTFRPVQSENLSDHLMHGERYSIPENTLEALEEVGGRTIAVGTTAVRALETFGAGGGVCGTTSIFIRPGFKFKIVDGMFTNFHLPRTTMLMMISALAGRESVFDAYRSAIEHRYRFLSFGDSMLII